MKSHAITFAASVLAGCGAASLAYAQTPGQVAAQQHAVLEAIVTIDNRCRMLNPAQRAAVEAGVRERAVVSTEAERWAIQANTNALQTRAQQTNCASPEGATMRAQAAQQGEMQRVLWLARASAAADLAAQNPWAAAISPLGLVKDQLAAALATALATNPQAPQIRANMAIEAKKVLSRLCRISAPEAGCPADPAEPPPPLAYAWERGANDAAAQVTPLIARIPRGTASWSDVWVTRPKFEGADATAATVRCTVADHIFVSPPGTGAKPVKSRMSIPSGGYLPIEVAMVGDQAQMSFAIGDVPLPRLREFTWIASTFAIRCQKP